MWGSERSKNTAHKNQCGLYELIILADLSHDNRNTTSSINAHKYK